MESHINKRNKDRFFDFAPLNGRRIKFWKMKTIPVVHVLNFFGLKLSN